MSDLPVKIVPTTDHTEDIEPAFLDCFVLGLVLPRSPLRDQVGMRHAAKAFARTVYQTYLTLLDPDRMLGVFGAGRQVWLAMFQNRYRQSRAADERKLQQASEAHSVGADPGKRGETVFAPLSWREIGEVLLYALTRSPATQIFLLTEERARVLQDLTYYLAIVLMDVLLEEHQNIVNSLSVKAENAARFLPYLLQIHRDVNDEHPFTYTPLPDIFYQLIPAAYGAGPRGEG